MKRVKIGVLGISNHFTKRVLYPLKGSKKVEIHAISSRDAEKSEKFAQKHGIPKWYGSYEDLLADSEIDAVYIPLPNHLHLEYIKKAADAGKSIICEKPITLDSEQAKEAFEYAEKRGVVLMEAFMYKFHPQWIHAKELLLSNEIGNVRSIHCMFAYDNEDPHNIRNVREFGGGALLDIGVYAVSTARYIMDLEPKRVISFIERDPKFGIDILTSAIVDFGGPRSVFTVSTQSYPVQRIEIYASEGKMSIEVPFNMYPDVPGRVTVETSIGKREFLSRVADQYLLEFEAFARAVKDGVEPYDFSQDSLSNMKTIDAIFRSAETGTWEDVK